MTVWTLFLTFTSLHDAAKIFWICVAEITLARIPENIFICLYDCYERQKIPRGENSKEVMVLTWFAYNSCSMWFWVSIDDFHNIIDGRVFLRWTGLFDNTRSFRFYKKHEVPYFDRLCICNLFLIEKAREQGNKVWDFPGN